MHAVLRTLEAGEAATLVANGAGAAGRSALLGHSKIATMTIDVGVSASDLGRGRAALAEHEAARRKERGRERLQAAS
jgi:hypothetical protein